MSRFARLEQSLADRADEAPQPPRGRPSGVLVLLSDADRPDIVLTRRPATLRFHAGQVALPGGRAEEEDADIVATALRETEEEVGIAPQRVHVLGQLPSFHVIVSQAEVTAVVGTWDGGEGLRIADPAEVAQIRRVGVGELANPAVRARARFPRGGLGPAFCLPDLFVWGFTAHVLDAVLRLGGWERPWDVERVVEIPSDYLGRPVS
ncbi:NUDIX hydrolase [Acidipropionibacterium timonense]|uniref:NUDIX hydrolase n=1 Tax=Acidipropionibacterium timonense TaxID=2161818 RepID=UPI001FDA6B5C|nr:CoA pyrophosphatase [Acidipropionibacterium timonense]